ncbi:MAG: VOC family protein [Alphaproteobacteria bacterium]
MARIVEFITVNLAVKDLDGALARFRALGFSSLAAARMPEPPAEITDVTLPLGREGAVSLIAATGPESPVARFLDKRGEGVYSIALRTDDLAELMREWTAAGVRWLLPEPYEFPRPSPAGRHLSEKLLANWVRPGSLHGVLVEVFELKGAVGPAPAG